MRWLWVVALASVGSAAARADQNDLNISQLGDPGSVSSTPANQRFRMLGDELGVALSATTLQPPTTLGMDGFAFDFEYTVAFINGSQQVGGQPYWVTQGGSPSILMMPALHFRKGLPYSLEVGGKVQAITNSSLYAGTFEAKWGIVEGFRYVPDLGARFAMTRLFGEQDMDLTTGEIDLSIGKEIGVGGVCTLSPYGGFSVIGVDSSSLVLLSNQSSITQAHYDQNPANSQILFQQNSVGQNLYERFYAGLILKSNIVSLAFEYSYARPESGDGLPVIVPIQQLAASFGLVF